MANLMRVLRESPFSRKFQAASCLLMVTLSTVAITACGRKPVLPVGHASMVRGAAVLVHGAERVPLRIGMVVREGDQVETGSSSAVVLKFEHQLGMAEIQSDSVFVVRSGDLRHTRFAAPKGNVWLKVQKLGKERELSLETPTTVAGVRGTQFFTFQVGDLCGTCQCEGKTRYSNTVSGRMMDHDRDSVTFTRGGKVAVLGADELRPFGFAHDHSMLDDSPLGRRNQADPKAQAAIFQLAEKKLASEK